MSDLRDNVVFITGGGSGWAWRWSSALLKKVRGSLHWSSPLPKSPTCASVLVSMCWR